MFIYLNIDFSVGGGIRKYGLAGDDMSLGTGAEASKDLCCALCSLCLHVSLSLSLCLSLLGACRSRSDLSAVAPAVSAAVDLSFESLVLSI